MIICLLFSVKKPSAQEHVKATTTAATNNKTVENDGWDDDDADWGSLEDCKFYIFLKNEGFFLVNYCTTLQK